MSSPEINPLMRYHCHDFRTDTKSGGHFLKAAENDQVPGELFSSLLSRRFLEVYKNVYNQRGQYIMYI